MSLILGIDPGSYITGYGIVYYDSRTIHYLTSGCINTKVIDDFAKRLHFIYISISNIIKEYNPDCLAIESVFVSKNPNSSLKLGQAQGAVIIAAINLNLLIFEYTSSKIKKTIVGIGSAKKIQVQYMVRVLLKLKTNPQEDAADALAAAITHCYNTNK